MAIDAVVEEVAENLEEAAEVTRSINTEAVGYFVVGVALGAALGFYFGYRFNKEKIKAEAFAESEKEIAKLREVYNQRVMAAQSKPSVEEIMEERGYSTAIEEHEEHKRPLRAPVPVNDSPLVREEKNKNQGWNYPEELANRSSEAPYVIHQDEFRSAESSTYSQTVYTYYAGDDVLTDTDDHPLPHADIIVGVDNLKFGHGTDDVDVVFVRNEKLELEMEICRVPQSYEEEVLGLEHNGDAEP